MIKPANPILMDRADMETAKESALALAQSTIQMAISESGASVPAAAGLLDGDHDLTIREMAGVLAVCGFEVCFRLVPRD